MKNNILFLVLIMSYILVSLIVTMVKNPEKRKIVHKTIFVIYTIFYGGVMYSCIKFLM